MNDELMDQAKAQFTAAAAAVLAGDPDAERLCREALQAIEAARTVQAGGGVLRTSAASLAQDRAAPLR